MTVAQFLKLWKGPPINVNLQPFLCTKVCVNTADPSLISAELTQYVRAWIVDGTSMAIDCVESEVQVNEPVTVEDLLVSCADLDLFLSVNGSALEMLPDSISDKRKVRRWAVIDGVLFISTRLFAGKWKGV